MNYYHGSKENNIEVLKVNHSKDGYVYVTSNKLVSLVYASREHVNLFITDKKEKIIKFLEYKPNLFKSLYKNKRAYIHVLENKNYEKVEISEHCSMMDAYKIKENVKIIDTIVIEDCYNEFLIYEKEGNFQLIRYEQMDEKSINIIKRDLKNIIKKHIDDQAYMSYINTYFNDLLN